MRFFSAMTVLACCVSTVCAALVKPCVLDFTTADEKGRVRHLGGLKEEFLVLPNVTADSTNRLSVARELFDRSTYGTSRPALMGADYFEAMLGKHEKVFACVSRKPVTAALEKLRQLPEYPQGCGAKLAEMTGATHLVFGTIGDLTTKSNEFSGYGVSTKTTNYSLDVAIKFVDLATGATAKSGIYTGRYREQRPISGEQFDNNVFQSLMKDALEQAAEGFSEKFAE